eukprot:scaffold10823_cov35-Tisochrysis_lutea.AAC.1
MRKSSPVWGEPGHISLHTVIVASTHRPAWMTTPVAAHATVDVLITDARASGEHAASIGGIAWRWVSALAGLARPSWRACTIRGGRRAHVHIDTTWTLRTVRWTSWRRGRLWSSRKRVL